MKEENEYDLVRKEEWIKKYPHLAGINASAPKESEPVSTPQWEKDYEEQMFFNELWQNLWEFANANGTITLSAREARELFNHISRDVENGEVKIKAFIKSTLEEVIEKIPTEITSTSPDGDEIGIYSADLKAQLRKEFL